MKKKEFDETLRTLVRHQPFQPFVVELVDGNRIAIDAPDSVAFNDGAAGYISSANEVLFFFQFPDRSGVCHGDAGVGLMKLANFRVALNVVETPTSAK